MDRKNLMDVFANASRRAGMRVRVKLFDGEKARYRLVRDYLRSLQGEVRPTDTVLFYYCGHGGESRFGNQRFAFYHDGKGPFRVFFEDEIEQLGTGRKILLYDCCSNRAQPRSVVRLDRSVRRSRASTAEVNPLLFRQLFFEGDNWVIISAATSGQVSSGDAEFGGLFTHSFVEALALEVKDLDADHDGRVSWSELFVKVKEKTRALEPTQVPQAHFLNECRASERYVKLVNKTGEELSVRFRYLRSDETDQLDPTQLTKDWLTFTIPAGGEVVAEEEGRRLRAYAYQFVAVGRESGTKWYHPRARGALRDQGSPVPAPINMGVPYNAGKDGRRIQTWVQTIPPEDRP
jgi:hypothetical protein